VRIGVDVHHLRLDGRGIHYYLWNTLEAMCRSDPRHRLTLYLYGQPWMTDPGLRERMGAAFPGAEIRSYWDGPSLRLPADPVPNGPGQPWLARQIDRRLRLPLYRKALAFETAHPRKGRLLTWPWHERSPAKSVDVFHHAAGLVFPLHARANVMTVYDLIPLRHPEYNPEAAEYFTESFAQAKHMDAVIAISEYTKRDVVARLDVPAAKVHVVPGAAHPQYRPVEDPPHMRTVLEKHGLHGKPYVLYVGAMERRKNVSRLVAAFGALRQGEAPVTHRLVLAGGGDPAVAADVRGRVDEWGLAEHVSFLGYVPFEELPALLSGADVFIFASLFEGFGLPPLEAMSCGVPVVVADATSLPEVVGDAGLLVPPEDTGALASALRRVLTDRGLHASLREKGLARARLFSWDRTARLTREAYEDAWRRWRLEGRRQKVPPPRTRYQARLHEWVTEQSFKLVAPNSRRRWDGGWP
jgi:glycosyltransferase involved in cell wall biosynthesis